MNNCDQMNLFVFGILIVCFTLSRNNDKENVHMMCKCVLLLLLGVMVWSIMFSEETSPQQYPPVESFRFEVSPWKQTCSTDHPDPRCCSREYVGGKKPYFQYSGDAERGQCNRSSVEPKHDESMKDKDVLKETYTSKQRIVENFESGCDCGM